MKLLTKDDFINIHKKNGEALAPEKIKEIACDFLQKNDLPTTKDENWKKTDIKRILKHRFEYGKKIDLDKFVVSMYNVSGTYANVLVFVNGHFCEDLTKITDEQHIFVFKNIAKAKTENHEIFDKYFNKSDIHNEHYFSALNTAYAEDGAFIYIKQNSVIENPIHVYNFVDGDNRKITSMLRNLIVAQKGSKAHVIFSYHSLSEDYFLTNVATEIFVEQNAYLDFNTFQGEGDDAFQINNTRVHQKKDSRFYSQTITMCGNIVRNDLNINIDGENCYTELNGLYFPDREQHFDNTINMNHKVGHSLSNQFYRGVLENNATAVFYGNVNIFKDAVKTEVHQKNNNILLSKHAKIHSKPHLIIHNDDVIASHGSTVGQLDKEALFYMQSRGIGQKKARTLLLTAFANEVIDKIQVPQFHFYTKFLLEKRMKGDKTDGMCSNMGACRG
ncbi:MAG: Fe-S cluster assembly protein SufD [Bacteroidales bacterium]|nr:Fe-S cluster assembly protein SufD [Bacteroidales bacterium]